MIASQIHISLTQWAT